MFGRKRSGPSLRPSIAQDLVVYGQFEFDPTNSNTDSSWIYDNLYQPYLDWAKNDPDEFTTQLAAAVLPVGGWAVYGGQRLVVDLITSRYDGTGYRSMQDAALDWLHEQGVSSGQLSGHEFERWLNTRGSGTW